MRRSESEGRGLAPCAVAVVVALLLACAIGAKAYAQAGGNTPGGAVPKAATPDVAKTAKATPEAPKAPVAKVAGNFGQWALVCGEVKDEAGKEPCSLVQALVEHDSQKLVFRLTVAYGPKGNLATRERARAGPTRQSAIVAL